MSRIQIHLKSFQLDLLKKALFIIKEKYLFRNKVQTHVLKRYIQKYTVIRSPHVHKKSREQFELIEYHFIFSINVSKSGPFLFLLKSSSFFGVNIKTSITSSSAFLEPFRASYPIKESQGSN